MKNEATALLLVDVQNGFMPNGELPVADGDAIVPVINAIIDNYPLVVASQDWHPASHMSFAANHADKKPFDVITLNGLEQVLWPVHCVANTPSAELHPQLKQTSIAAVFRKGMNPAIDSYSTFYDNGKRFNTGLAAYLAFHNIQHIHVVGLAADYCVYYSIQDALAEGFAVTLIENATRAICVETFAQQKAELMQHPKFSLVIA